LEVMDDFHEISFGRGTCLMQVTLFYTGALVFFGLRRFFGVLFVGRIFIGLWIVAKLLIICDSNIIFYSNDVCGQIALAIIITHM